MYIRSKCREYSDITPALPPGGLPQYWTSHITGSQRDRTSRFFSIESFQQEIFSHMDDSDGRWLAGYEQKRLCANGWVG